MAITNVSKNGRKANKTCEYRKLMRLAINEVTMRERSKRSRDWEVRRHAAGLYFGDSVLRCGGWAGAFQSRMRAVIEHGRDLTAIPGYDSLAAQVAEEFPEYSDDGGCERLWDFLLSPHEKMPTRSSIKNRAAQWLYTYSKGKYGGDDEEPKPEKPRKTKQEEPAIFPACYAEVRDLVRARRNILLVGPAGCGKSHLASLVAKALGLPFGAINCTAGMSEAHLLGRAMPNLTNGSTTFQSTEFLRCYEQSGVFLMDEIDAADPNVLLAINTAIANGYCNVPSRPENPRATKHPNFVLICTANTFGRGANRSYSGRNQLDEASLDRFRIGIVEMWYDETVEASVCPIKALREKLVAVRDKIEAAGLRRILSTRFLVDAYVMHTTCDWTAMKILDVFFRGWSAEEKAKAGLN